MWQVAHSWIKRTFHLQLVPLNKQTNVVPSHLSSQVWRCIKRCIFDLSREPPHVVWHDPDSFLRRSRKKQSRRSTSCHVERSLTRHGTKALTGCTQFRVRRPIGRRVPCGCQFEFEFYRAGVRTWPLGIQDHLSKRAKPRNMLSLSVYIGRCI